MAERNIVESRLWFAAQHRAAEFGYVFADDCRESHFRPFLSGGVDQLERENYLDDPARISLAETNIVAFTTHMILAAQEMNMDELHEPTFFKVRDILCPLWPFCD